MTSNIVNETIDELSPTQRVAVEWEDNAILVLAGSGAGKTRILTTRIARILNDSPKRKFRILALTFTTKAGDEMRQRVEDMVPDLVGRTVIGTFHSFCTKMLRQHGWHLGIQPDFGIFDQDDDRHEFLGDALQGSDFLDAEEIIDDVKYLTILDRLRKNLITPEESARCFRDPGFGERIARVYSIYDSALRERGYTDFHGMILDTCRLVQKIPAVSEQIRKSYPYWLIDEFQDTTPSQYQLLRSLAGKSFKNIFAVADDDQIIYQWAGASFAQITKFRENFSPKLLQIVENHRCPAGIVRAANNLIAHNSERTPGKKRTVSMSSCQGEPIEYIEFATDSDEVSGVVSELSVVEEDSLGKIAILSRTQALLQPVSQALKDKGIAASLTKRRNRFVSPQFLWLLRCLELSLRPGDRRKFFEMATAANRVSNLNIDVSMLDLEARTSGISYLESWALSVKDKDDGIGHRLSDLALRLIQSRSNWRNVVSDALEWLPSTVADRTGVVTDIDEDRDAWKYVCSTILSERGAQPSLDEFLQQMSLRPKNPPRPPNSVCLSTIHSAKGLEFDTVWLIGAAEDILPSWQSLQPDAKFSELEEERRNFFVAITRTRKRLIVSCAKRYRGWQKNPSRFIDEMHRSI